MRKELIAQKDPKSHISEVFRTLRTNIQFMNTNKKLKTLLVTSTFPGEGKSWVASNLAVTFAQAGKRVILIDADMRKGRQYAIFGVSPRPGLSNYLSGIDEDNEDDADIANYIQKTEVENLLLISAGNIPPNPSELLVSPRTVKLLDELKEVCDIIIIDGTPSDLVTDSVILSRIVDSTVIVTAYKETKKDALERVIKNIQNVGGHLAGVVFNKLPVSAKKYTEAYYYASTLPSVKRRTSPKTTDRNIDMIRKRASASIAQNMPRIDKTELEGSHRLNATETQNGYSKNGEDLATPNILRKKDENNAPLDNNTLDKTQNILNQINSYLDQEKKNLN